MSTKQPFLAPTATPSIATLPKCNIHTHLEGSVRPSTYMELAVEHGIESKPSLDAVSIAMQVTGSENNLVDYLDKISYGYQVFLDKNSVQRIAYEAAEDAALDGVVYLELRAGPITHSSADFSVEQVIESILMGLHQAEHKYNIVCRLIVSALRHHDPKVNVKLAHTAIEFKHDGVVGFDLAGDEAGYLAQPHAEAFSIARNNGLGITVHAGEAGGTDNVLYAIEKLKATRIGHGIRSIESQDLVKLLKQRQVLLELCPTSNVHTKTVDSIKNHPVSKFYNEGVPISIGDDDPITSRTSVSRELTLLENKFGFGIKDIIAIQKMSIEAAFITDQRLKSKLLQIVSTP